MLKGSTSLKNFINGKGSLNSDIRADCHELFNPSNNEMYLITHWLTACVVNGVSSNGVDEDEDVESIVMSL